MHELNWMHTAVVLIALSAIFYLVRLVAKPPASGFAQKAGWGSLLLAFLCMIVSLVIRSQTAQYFALSNMYESLLVVCLGIQLVFLVLDQWFSGKLAIRTLGLPVCLLLLAAVVFDLSLPTHIKPLQPALQSYWRSIHVPIILLSYALFTVAFLSSFVYLVKSALEKSNDPATRNSGGGGQRQAAVTPEGITFDALALADDAERDKANVYDEITYRCVAFGFPMLLLGIILGGIWANEAWGNYWSWDPKESMALVTLLAYGVYLHLRVKGGHSARMLAWVSVTGFLLMLVTYFGVNLMGIGLHSYGKIG